MQNNRDKPPDIEQIFKRLDRVNGIQAFEKGCCICSKGFSRCTHSMADVEAFKEVWTRMNRWGRKRVS
jgi:hypothetical protein